MLPKHCVVLGFALALVRFAASQEFNGKPQCASACFARHTLKIGCSLTNIPISSACQCIVDEQVKFRSEIWPCFERSCTVSAETQMLAVQLHVAALTKWAYCAHKMTFATEVRGGRAAVSATPTRIPTIATAATTVTTLIASSSPPLPVDRGPEKTSSPEGQPSGSSTTSTSTLLGSITDAQPSATTTITSDLPPFSDPSPPDSNYIATDSRPARSFSGPNPAAIGIGVGVGVTVLVFLYLAVFFLRRYRRKKRGSTAAGDESVVSPGHSDGLIPSLAALAPRKTELPAAHIAEMPVHDDPTRGRVEAPFNERQVEIATEEGIQGRHELRGDEGSRAP